MANRARKLASYDIKLTSISLQSISRYADDQESTCDYVEGRYYDPIKHWQCETDVPSGMVNDCPAYKKGYLADVTFFKNKCQELGEDLEATLQWYKERYAHLPKRYMTYFVKALDKEYNKAKERIEKSENLKKQSAITKFLKDDDDAYDLD
jgi:hypothetical protein